jgi:hypothetical protein
MFAQLETEPHGKPDCPESPGRILNITQVMEHAHGLFLEVALPSKKIYQQSKIFLVKSDRKSIYGKIPSVEVLFYGRCFNFRQCGR